MVVVMTIIRVEGNRSRYSSVYFVMYRCWAPVQVQRRISEGVSRDFGRVSEGLGMCSHIEGATCVKSGMWSWGMVSCTIERD